MAKKTTKPQTETTKTETATKTEPKPTTKKAKAKEPATKKDAVERDAFGCRVGSQAATINATIGKKPVTTDAIAEKTGLDRGRIRAHIKHLIAKELVKEGDDGVTAL